MPILDIQLKPSNIYKAFFLTLLVGSFFSVALLSLSLLNKFFLSLILVGYTYRIYLKRNKITHFKVLENQLWMLFSQDGTYQTAQLRGDSYLTQFLMILRWSTLEDERILTCVIFKDSLPPHLFCQLHVKVRSLRKLL